MKNYKFYTIIFLLFTASTLASCVNTSKKSTTNSETSTKSEIKKSMDIQKSPTIRKVDAETFKIETEGKKVQLVDVRTPEEHKQGHIENSDNVNVMDNDFMTKMAKYNKDQTVYVYCRSGGRSMRAAEKLKAAGFNVVNLNGGMIGWSKNGFKEVK